MKSFALSVACVVGFASPGFCGELGRADITEGNISTSDSFSANCFGTFDEPKGPECLVNFSKDKMTVDSSSGISPNQIVSVSPNWHPNGYFISVQYVNSAGDSSLAQFSFLDKPVANQFLNTVAEFMGGNLALSSEPTSTPAIVEDVVEDEAIEFDSPDSCEGPSILCF